MKVITLCGSTSFYKEFDEAMLNLTIAGWSVFTIGTHRFSDKDLIVKNNLKEQFTRMHYEKINFSDAVMIIDVDNYIGESTTNEINHAIIKGKPIFSFVETKKHKTWKHPKILSGVN